MTPILGTAVEVARQAGALLAERFNLSGTAAVRKADRSLVTEADLAADRLIETALKAQFPLLPVLSEEKQTAFDTLPDELWVVDPLDGTTNFSLGLHYWGVSIAYLKGGMPQAAAIFFPLLDELYTAETGAGAFLNGRPVRVQPYRPNHPAPFFSCCSRTFQRYNVTVPFKARILGSTAYSLCCVSRGAALASFDATAKVWDVAGGWVVVQEAGGVTGTLLDEPVFPIQPHIDYSEQSFAAISAADPIQAEALRRQIIPAASARLSV